MKTKPIKLVYATRSIGKGKTLDERTSLTTSSMVWHPYHMTHTSIQNYINFPTQGSGHFVLQRGNSPAGVKNPQIFQGTTCTIMYIFLYMELPPSRNRWAIGTKVQKHKSARMAWE